MTGTTVIGNVNVDLLVRADELPPPGQEWIVEGVDCRVGGAAANAALAMAALGSPPRLVGCVGDDHFGRFLLSELSARGLDGDVQVVPGRATGVSLAFESAGRDRSFLIGLGSLETFDRAAIPTAATAASHLLLCGYFTLPSLRGEPTGDVLRATHSAGGTTFFDTGWDPDGWGDATMAEVRALLPAVDVFLPNELEAAALAGTSDVVASTRALQAVSEGWVVVKRGADGCLAVGPDRRELRVDSPPVSATDTTGAGDAFNAALVVALAAGQAFEEALRFATTVASAVVARPSSDRYPTLEDVGGRFQPTRP